MSGRDYTKVISLGLFLGFLVFVCLYEGGQRLF